MRSRWLWIAGILIASIALLIVFVRSFVDEQLRETIERNVNTSLDGYTVQIRALHFHPLGFGLDLIDSTIVQNAHSDPPVAHLPKLSASVNWQALLYGRLVADFLLDRPTLHINLKQARSEIKDKVSIDERGWQDALGEIYPLKVNEFAVRDAKIIYADEGPFKPLRLSRVNFRARNIRNIHSKERVYPSDIRLEGNVFDSGKVMVNGHADFLAKPHAGIKAAFTAENVELDYFKPIIRRYHVSVRDGVLSTDGKLEYAPKVKVADLEHITIQGVHIDYVHSTATEAAEKEVAKDIARTAKKVSNDPEVLLRVDKINILKSTFAFVNQAAEPDYRIFFADADLKVNNLSNRGAEGKGVGTLHGKFMGSGDTKVNFTFQPKAKGADFDLHLAIENTNLPAMNDFLLAYGNFDVVGGVFSFYSELAVRNGEVNGYIKPLFREMDVYDAHQEGNKPFFTKVREGVVAAAAWLLKNRRRDEVATRVTISGRIDGPQFSTWEALFGLLKNAFINAVTPGFEKQDDANIKVKQEREIPS